MMVSLTCAETNFLITNREIVGDDVVPFEYAPKPEFDKPMQVYNEINEK